MKRTCLNCSEDFQAKNKRAKFCSVSCRSSYWQQMKRKRIKNSKKDLVGPGGKILDNQTLKLLMCCDKTKLIRVDDEEIQCYNCGRRWITANRAEHVIQENVELMQKNNLQQLREYENIIKKLPSRIQKKYFSRNK
jgi:hypothetical protein